MSYPQTLGYQSRSETSRMAAEQCTTAASLEKNILAYLDAEPHGFIGDNFAFLLDIPIGTASARLRGLELKGHIFKTEETRLTRSNRKAFVYRSTKYLDPQMNLGL